MNLKRLFVVFLFYCFGISAQETTKRVAFRSLTVENGLSQNSVVSIAQDSIGYIWFATQDGLNRYDGRNFKYFNKQYQDVTRSNYAQLGQLHTDHLGDLWSYSSNEIIEKLNYTTQEFDSISSINQATVFHRKNQHELWVGTLDKGIMLLDLKSKTVEPLFKNQLDNVSVFEIQNINNTIYLGTSIGVFKIYQDRLLQIKSTKNLPVSSIVRRDQFLIFGTYGKGLKLIDLESDMLSSRLADKLSNNLNVQDLFLDSKSRLWVATYGDGLYMVDRDNSISHYTANKENPFALHYDDILKIYEDETGNIWFGSDGAGLSFYDEHLVKFNSITSKQVPETINVEVVRSIAVNDNGMMWLGTSGKGLTTVDRENKIYKTYTSQNSKLSSDRIMSLQFVGDKLWIGHQSNGLQLLSSNDQFESVSELNNQAIWKIYKGTNNHVWLCTRTDGIIKYDIDKGILEKYNSNNSILPNNIRTVQQGRHNELWIGSENQGLFKLDTNSKKIEKISQIEDKIKSLLYFNKVLWVGTNGNGIKSIDVESNTVKEYEYEYDFANKVVYAILPDDHGNFWVSTNKGISKFTPNNSNKHYVENYSIINGLQAFEFNTGAYFKASNGLLYFGGIEGVNWFDPDEISYNNKKPKTVISKFEVFDKEYPVATDLKFKHHENTMTFNFAGLHFSHPEKNFYRYKLVNHDEDWSKPEYKNTAHYTNLPPNDYTFKVLSSNYEGIWNKEPTSFSFTILKPWYATNFLLSVYGFLLLLSIYSVYRYFKYKWKLETQVRLEHAETERLKKIDEFKTKLYTNISHEFRTPLTLISGPIEQQLSKPDLPESDKKELSLVKQNANRLLNLVNQMLDLSLVDSGQIQLKVTQGHLSIVLKQLVAAFQYKAKEKQMTISANIQSIETAWFDKDVIEKIVSNLLSNAIKYAPNGSDILFDVAKQEDTVVMSVINTNKNIKQKDLGKLFQRFYQNDLESDGVGVGLALVKELVNLSKGTIIANNLEDNKIQFTVSLPVNKESFSSQEILKPINATSPDLIKDVNTKSDDEQMILIVEDDSEIRNFVASIFNSNYKVIEAINGEEGIAFALKHIPDIIISDVMMPIIDGVELCNTLKFNQLTSHIPIILLTAKVGEEHKIEGLKSGADAYITKPFNNKLLTTRVEQLIKSRIELKNRYSEEFTITPELAITSTEAQFLKHLKEVLDAHITKPDFKSEDLSRHLLLSRTHLHRKLKAVYGLSTSEFMRSQRIKLATKLLRDSDATISEIAYQVGFNSASYFIKSFKEIHNQTPSDYRLAI